MVRIDALKPPSVTSSCFALHTVVNFMKTAVLYHICLKKMSKADFTALLNSMHVPQYY